MINAAFLFLTDGNEWILVNNNIKRRLSGRVTNSLRVSNKDQTNVVRALENDDAAAAAVQEGFSVLDLNPETHYQLRMTAHNSAGSTVRIYEFTTLTFGGATVAPELIIHSEYNYGGFINLLLNPSVILPILLAIIVIVVIILVLSHQLKKDRLFVRGE